MPLFNNRNAKCLANLYLIKHSSSFRNDIYARLHALEITIPNIRNESDICVDTTNILN